MSSDRLTQSQKLAIGAVIARLEEAIAVIYPTCANCMNYDHKLELCTLARTRPPAKVIVRGCPSWEDDIPF